MMEKVRLNKENYVTLMQTVKAFVEDKITEKKGYKILIKVIERIELANIDELLQIKEEITQLMRG